MMGLSLMKNPGLKLTLIFGSAGSFDRAWTKLRLKWASSDERVKLIDGYHLRWERRLRDEMSAANNSLELMGVRPDVTERRARSLEPELAKLRNNKESLLHFNR